MDAPLKIALVVDHFPPRVGGIELHVSDLAERLAGRGHDVTVFTTTPHAHRRLVRGYRVERVPASVLPHVQIIWQPGPILQLRRLLEQRGADVAHIHASIISPLAYGSLWACHNIGLPTVFTNHSRPVLSAHLFRALDRACGWSDWPAALTAVSRFNADRLAFAARRDDVTVLPNGIDTNAWRIERKAHEELRVTSVMRLYRKKRPGDLLFAIPQVLAQLRAGRKVRFTVVGDGPFRPWLERVVARLGLQQVVEFTGFLPRPAIRDLFRTTDLFALPTLNEAFGIALVEARAAGIPVVARAGSGVNDVVDHGQNGLLATSAPEFATAIARLLTDDALRVRMSANAPVGLEKFSWPRVLDQHETLYRQAARLDRTQPFSRAA